MINTETSAMAGITYEQVSTAADAITAEGEHPSIMRVREWIGSGSPNTIHRHLKAWRAAQAPTERPSPEIPGDVARPISDAMDRYAAARSAEAQQEAEDARVEADTLAETGEQIESERDAALERADTAERVAEETTQRADAAEADAIRLATEIERARENARTARDEASRAEARAESAISERDRLADQVERLRDDAAAAKALQEEIAYAREQIQRLENRLYDRIDSE
jgi:DNA repair exonuclease SbcCD ATPase subunit